MIQYNLKQDKWKNHPMDGKYGVIVTNSRYANYPVTIVDNSQEVVNGRYTGIHSLCLLHLSENVRQYIHLKVFDEMLYQSFSFVTPTYRMHEYPKTELSTDEIIAVLKQVFYLEQPSLQSRSCVGSSSKRLEDDPNYYEGHYVLNDEEEYTILKIKGSYKFFKGRKTYYPNWKDSEDLIFEGEINFDIYKLALEVDQLRRDIVVHTNNILDDDDNDKISEYKTKLKDLKILLKDNGY